MGAQAWIRSVLIRTRHPHDHQRPCLFCVQGGCRQKSTSRHIQHSAGEPPTSALLKDPEGANEPISGEEIAAQIAPDELSALAEQAGLSEAEVAANLAEEIPPLVDALPAKAAQEAISPAQPVRVRQGRSGHSLAT
ncbi:YidB family protein [Streptomyces sp. NPDC002701]|uniref:YidB family protein n=1 Tax=Streptomyces sp. NPDC002701 TaxID=3364661 RepID=UPI0036C6D112